MSSNMNNGGELQESGENYLEAILRLDEESGFVRSVDVATKLGVTKPSVCRAIRILAKKGLLTMESDGALKLTGKGRKTAGAVYERHKVLTEFFVKFFGISSKTAETDACRIEHVVSEETFERIKEYVLKNYR